MEVHHHPHVEKKKFKEYFLEFLMIFLAVTMGFFAESLRESISDHSKAREYIQSFYDDLKTDTAKISKIVLFDDEKIKGLSDISNCCDTVLKNPQSSTCLFGITKNTILNMPFQVTERTFQQLANTGSFRILPKQDADSITKYFDVFNTIRDFQSTGFQQAQDEVRIALMPLINAKASLQLINPILKGEFLFSHDLAALNKFFNELIKYRAFVAAQRSMLEALKENQIRLLKFFDREYHFE
ncbi:MAG TPA: hypothetical protein VKR32_13500 [Puia sp.]|nr:hypothetical protein [Puia sp.]